MSKQENKLTINQKISQLDQAVDWFYGEDFNLDQALIKYQNAIQLTEDIKNDLEQLKNQVEVIADFTKS